MRYGSVCSGIEAASVAWKPLHWVPAFFSEIAPFPSAVLAHHYGANLPGEPVPVDGVPNHGDMTRFREWPDHAINVLVGGTPCQSHSVGGLRKGLDDPRGSLMLTYGAIARRYRPLWVVWENVPGVLSVNGGYDFAAFLGLLVQLGYGWAYRVLDCQFVRVDGFWRAVPQRRRRVFVVGYLGDWRQAAAVLFERESFGGHIAPGDGSEQALTYDPGNSIEGGCRGERVTAPQVANTLTARMHKGVNSTLDEGQTLIVHCGPDVAQSSEGHAVRKLTPVECERLQGFPDNYTQIRWRGNRAAACPDGPRYSALGNSMPVNVMRWIGRRIELVTSLQSEV